MAVVPDEPGTPPGCRRRPEFLQFGTKVLDLSGRRALAAMPPENDTESKAPSHCIHHATCPVVVIREGCRLMELAGRK